MKLLKLSTAVHIVLSLAFTIPLIVFIIKSRTDFDCKNNVCPVGVFSSTVNHTLTLALGLECSRLGLLVIAAGLLFSPLSRVFISSVFVLHLASVLGAVTCGALFSNDIVLNSAGKKGRDSTALFILSICDVFQTTLFFVNT
jgi:hypothetical protein